MYGLLTRITTKRLARPHFEENLSGRRENRAEPFRKAHFVAQMLNPILGTRRIFIANTLAGSIRDKRNRRRFELELLNE